MSLRSILGLSNLCYICISCRSQYFCSEFCFKNHFCPFARPSQVTFTYIELWNLEMKQQCYTLEEKLAMYSRLTKLRQFPSCYNFELTLNSRGLFKNVSITIIFYYVKKCCSNTGKCFPPKMIALCIYQAWFLPPF